jgi:hypothetical protein
MNEEMDLGQVARQFIRHYGKDAPYKTACLAFEAQRSGADDGCDAWLSVTLKIYQIDNPAPARGSDTQT